MISSYELPKVTSTFNTDNITYNLQKLDNGTLLEKIVHIEPNVKKVTIPEGITRINWEAIIQLSQYSVEEIIMPSTLCYFNSLENKSEYEEESYINLTLDFSKCTNDIGAACFNVPLADATIKHIIINNGSNLNILGKSSSVKTLTILPSNSANYTRLSLLHEIVVDNLMVMDGTISLNLSNMYVYKVNIPYSVEMIWQLNLNKSGRRKGFFKLMDYNPFFNELSCRKETINPVDWQEEIKELKLCSSGYHYCYYLSDLSEYYVYHKEITRVAEIEVDINCDISGISNKGVTNNYKIKKLLTHEEFIDELNSYKEDVTLPLW